VDWQWSVANRVEPGSLLIARGPPPSRPRRAIAGFRADGPTRQRASLLVMLLASCRATSAPDPSASSSATPAEISAPSPSASRAGPPGSLTATPPRRPAVVDCAAVASCVARFAKPRLSTADIRDFASTGGTCFATQKEILWQQRRCLPLTLGTDVRNGMELEVAYFCADLCPEYGRILLQYRDVAGRDCCRRGGYPVSFGAPIRSSWCAPPEFLARKQYRRRRPGAPNEPVARSPCDSSQVVFEDGTVINDPRTPAVEADCDCPPRSLACHMRCISEIKARWAKPDAAAP
jgi:hypothetical protein